MAPTQAPEAQLPPPEVRAGGTYKWTDISTGCTIYALRPCSPKEQEERKAEILSVRSVREPATGPADIEYFVHWDQFNKRLDEWISATRVILERDLELPRPKPNKNGVPKAATAHIARPSSTLKKAGTNGRLLPTTATNTPSPGPTLKRKAPDDEQDDEDADGEAEVTLDLAAPVEQQASAPVYSKDQEIEKLRTSGSMTQSIGEVARVKNLNRLQIGRHEVEAWYFSPYPKEFAHLHLIYICEFCLSYFSSPMMLSRHRRRCTLLHPPGNEIYRLDDISFFELDGKKQLTWCRNLSLLSKCFLDHKTLYYDVQPFLYYVMCKRDDAGCHIIGYFSKEKESAENYNVACILTLPQHQRHGYGKLLIEFSYELSKKEGKLGSPEKPLSDLGLLSYRTYWAETIIALLVNAKEDISIDDIAHKTSITHSDIMNTCKTLELFKHYNATNVIYVSDTVKAQYEKSLSKRKRKIDSNHLIWKPPVFTRDQLRFAY